jgi:hypothetical protein
MSSVLECVLGNLIAIIFCIGRAIKFLCSLSLRLLKDILENVYGQIVKSLGAAVFGFVLVLFVYLCSQVIIRG